MKHLLSVAIFALALGATSIGAAEEKKAQDPWKNCRDWFEVKYDKFNDVTLIRPKNLRREGLKVGNDNMGFWLSVSIPGQKYNPKKPPTITLIFSDLEVDHAMDKEKALKLNKLVYRDCSNLVMLVDGVKMDFGTLKYEAVASIDGGLDMTYIDQTLKGSLTLAQLKKLAAAKKVEGQLCESTFEFKKDEICILNMILEYFK